MRLQKPLDRRIWRYVNIKVATEKDLILYMSRASRKSRLGHRFFQNTSTNASFDWAI